MTRKTVDPVNKMGLAFRSGSKKQKKGESREKFVERIQKGFPTLILKANANIEVVALCYDVDVKILKIIVAANAKCVKTYTKARAIAASLKHESLEVSAALKRQAEAEASVTDDNRLKRKRWPVDEDEREVDIKDALMVSLLENEGNMVEVSECLNLPLHEILEVVDGDEELMACKDRGLQVAVLQAEAALIAAAKSGNQTAVKMLLTNRSEEWTDRQSVTVTHSGFKPPSEKDAPDTVLSMIVGGKAKEH